MPHWGRLLLGRWILAEGVDEIWWTSAEEGCGFWQALEGIDDT